MTTAIAARYAQASVSPSAVRALLVAITAAACLAAWFATSAEASASATAAAGADLTRLLRAMAAIKAIIAIGLITAVLWRLSAAVTPLWFAAYAATCAAMAAGPALIWRMDAVGTGALLLHAGLLVSLILLWRDPAVTARLSEMIAMRRARRT